MCVLGSGGTACAHLSAVSSSSSTLFPPPHLAQEVVFSNLAGQAVMFLSLHAMRSTGLH
jgi:hypothetical protein